MLATVKGKVLEKRSFPARTAGEEPGLALKIFDGDDAYLMNVTQPTYKASDVMKDVEVVCKVQAGANRKLYVREVGA